MSGHVVKMLGGGELRSILAGYILPGGFQQFDKPVQLTGGDESVDRVGKQQHLRPANSLQRGRKVLFQSLDTLPRVEDPDVVLRVQDLQVVNGLQRDRVLPLWAAVDDQNIHSVSFLCRFSSL